MSGRKRSNVWTYYRESEEDRSKVKCTICDKMISRGGSGRKGSSSALSNHLKLKHAMEYTNLERAVCRVSSNTPDDEAMQQEPVAAQDVQPSTSGTQPSNSKTFTITQSTLEDSFISKWKIDDPRSVPITKSIAEMIAVDNQPISVVEDKGFNRLMQLVKPKYQMPKREWMLLQHCLVLLQPFEEITKKVSSTYSCISEVIPHTKILQKFLIKEEVQRTCSYNYTIATLLDPRYKMNFFTPEKVSWVRRQFLAEYVRRSADMDSTSNSENESEPPAPLPYSGLQSQEGTHKALWTCYEELASAKQPEIEEPKSPIAIELDRYIADSLLSRIMCPYKCSVYSERLFSEAGNVYEQKRNKLLPNKADHLVFLHHNYSPVNIHIQHCKRACIYDFYICCKVP
ncbi:hypothetical protein ABMA27_007792 [Loxostege sticticalis]|uniref:BED-type domain-containing protein n=1 Tax=Loxostege sticticalis TaxID=481309 RepID=A0ABR3HCX9_LOXSC